MNIYKFHLNLQTFTKKITVYFSSYKTNVENVVLTRTDSEFEYRTPESYVLKYCKPSILLLYRDYSDIKYVTITYKYWLFMLEHNLNIPYCKWYVCI